MNADRRHLARLVLAVFLATFASARVLVFLIMDHRLPDLYFYVGETHVHHLNYGIFLLSAVGALLLFGRPGTRSRQALAVLYAIGLALTFDEFGMWLHLHDGYWQRASFDAIILIAALLGLLAFLPDPRQWSLRKKLVAFALLLLIGTCLWLLMKPLSQLETHYGPALHRIESNGPS
ncbi:MAG TPA: hypothetical protein VHF02_09250 [Luteimonas sp.]|nr:hypothetical protein [Luteimonas sp.]